MRKSALYLFGLVVTLLVALGLVVLSSASEANGIRLHNDAYFFMKRQFVYLFAGLFLAFGVVLFDYRKWRDYEFLTWFFFIGVMVLLVAVFGFRAINGSHRWIALGPVRLQPSELAKLLTVVFLSVWLDKSGWRVELFRRGALYPVLAIAAIGLPVFLEPDYGSVMVICLVGGLMMFVAGTRLVHLVPFALLGAGILACGVLTNANRIARLFDESKQYQVKMALAAIGNSDIWGAGLGESMQKHLYLPEAHTDFVFAVGAEELGIVFSVTVIFLFVAFFILSIYIARKAADRLGRFLVIGMAFIIFFQAMFNLGVVCKALPTKGMALPFFSYGGTNLLASFFAVGTILSVGIHSYRGKKHALMRRVFLRKGKRNA